jgi:hypothetical protein
LSRKPFERLEEVRERRLVILVLGVEDAGLSVELGLEQRWAIDRVGSSPSACESSFGLGKIGEGVVDAGFEKVDFGEDHLVV